MKFDKDEWILRAIKSRAILVDEDSTVRRLSFLKLNGKRVAQYTIIITSVHKRSGRVYFNLTFDGITKSVLLNRVVGLALLPNPDNLPEVNHKDGNKANNRKDNLEWASRVSQEKHAQSTGLKTGRGSSNSQAKLDADKVAIIRKAAKENPRSLGLIAKTFKITVATVKDIRDGRTWAHV